MSRARSGSGSRPGRGSGRTPSRAARLVLLPALAADRRGVRLGQGGGFYDRTLPLVGADVALVVVLDDGELVDTCPPNRTTAGWTPRFFPNPV